jgi:hypothetical protein
MGENYIVHKENEDMLALTPQHIPKILREFGRKDNMMSPSKDTK